MKLKRTMAGIAAFVLVVSLCACGVQDAPGTGDETKEITVTDMVGREVKVVPGSYKKVVCIGAGALRMYSYIGEVSLLAGVEDIDNTSLAERPKMFDSVARPYMLAFGEEFSQLPSCGVGGPMAQAAEAEKILGCDPDIVISEFEDADKSNALQDQLGVPVITLTAGNSVFDEMFFETLNLLGKVLGKEDKAQTLVDFIKSEKAAIEAKVADIADEDKPSVYICGLGNWGTTNHLMTSANYTSFQVAGIKNAVSDLGIRGIGPMEEEKFVELGESMDIMILDAAAVKNIQPLYAEDNTLLDTCKAWQNGEVYLEMAYNAYYTNYEISLINTWFVAKTVYPELFADVDITAKTNEVTKAFLGQELADEIFACPASFGGYQKIDTKTFFEG